MENDEIIKSVQVPWELFEISDTDESVENAFYAFHNFDISTLQEQLKECSTCSDQNVFIRYSCFCSFCTSFNEDMADEPINEYILHCFECHKCLCKASPESCFGCALIDALRRGNMDHLKKISS